MHLHIISRSCAIKNNIKKYFTGKPCKYGHVALRFSCNAKCLHCHEDSLERPKKILTDLDKLEKRKNDQKNRGRKYYEMNKSKVKQRSKSWKKNNPDKLRDSGLKWRSKETSKAITFMRSSLRRVLKTEKNGRTEKILGYTRFDLIKHIEKQFTKGMSWDNYGEWHIDHIIPVSVLLSQGVTEPNKINCLSNLRPLWAGDNLSKGAKVEFLI